MKNSNNSSLEVGDMAAAAGERVNGYVSLCRMADQRPLQVPVSIINGARPGPVLYLQAASDGNELNGAAVVQHIMKELAPDELSGAVIVVPLVNVTAFGAHTAHSPVDRKKMNRCFPGKKKGTLSERIAHFLFHHAVIKADYCIDLHQGGVNPMVDECRVRVNLNERMGHESLELAKVFGIGHIYREKGPDGQLARAAPAAGIPTIDPELGGCRGWDETSICKGIRGVRNVLRHYGLTAARPEIPAKQTVVRRLKTVYADTGGFLNMLRNLYDHVERGECIAEILDPFGCCVGHVRSPAKGVLWSKIPYPFASEGERVAQIGTQVSYI